MKILKLKDWLELQEVIYLHADNLEKWIYRYNKIIFQYTGIENYSSCMSNEYWLNDWSGATPEEAVSEEMSCWDQEE